LRWRHDQASLPRIQARSDSSAKFRGKHSGVVGFSHTSSGVFESISEWVWRTASRLLTNCERTGRGLEVAMINRRGKDAPPFIQSVGGHSEQVDGVTAVIFYQSCIANADTKIGFVSTGLTVLGAATFTQLRKFVWNVHIIGWRDVVAGILLIIAVAAVTLGSIYVVSALNPRVKAPIEFSRYAFPVISRQPPGFTPVLDPGQQRKEAWIEARALAIIAMRKFLLFQRGLYLFCTAAPALGIAVIVAR
jgi:hypothetical protein